MEILIDVAIVAFIPLMVYRGYRRGAIYTFMTSIVVFTAFCAAVFLSENFSESVGRLIQPVVKREIVTVLEEALKFEDVIVDHDGIPTVEVEGENEPYAFTKQEYLSMTRALEILSTSRAMDRWAGFVEQTRKSLYIAAVTFDGAVTTEISTVMGEEMARVWIMVISFTVLTALWLLMTRRLKLKFEGETAIVNANAGAVIGFCLSILLIYVFAWMTSGTIVKPSGVTSTMLFEFFSTFNPLENTAHRYMVEIDI